LLALRISETDGNPSRLWNDEVPLVDEPDPDDDVPLVDDVLPDVDEVDEDEPVAPEDDVPPVLWDEDKLVGSEPGVPSSAAAWPRTESAFARASAGSRNDA
jgi:hypothetical protein